MRRINWFHLQRKLKLQTLFRNAILGFALNSTALFANPEHHKVVAGSAEIIPRDHSTVHIHTSDKAIINWDRFSIGKGELTKFIQPNKSSAVLNRVTGSDLSAIYGRLESNGNVYLINPNGILVADGAVINTGGFLASTLDVLDADFLAGGDLNFSGPSQQGIVNLGTIESTAGDVVLIGYNVDNQGSILAKEGAARLFAGSELLLQVQGDERILIKPNRSSDQVDRTALINSGSIEAVVAELKADGNPYLLGINHTGSITATGIVEQNGQVYLRAENGRTALAGSIKATNADHTGGEVTVLGKQIAVMCDSLIDVSGDNGGGTVLIGGGYQGKDSNLPNAEQVVIQEGSNIFADANVQGDGGLIVNWSDNTMFHYGQMSAKGGQESGDGGFVEASGKKFLDYQGFANLTAPNGKWGTLLLDPTNLVISSAANSNVTASTPFYPNTPGTTANLNTTTIANALNVSNVFIQTGNDNGAGPGDIYWNELITRTSNITDLTIQSANNIYISVPQDIPFLFVIGGYNDGGGDGSGSLNLFAQNNIVFKGPLDSTGYGVQLNFLVANGNFNVQTVDGDITFTSEPSTSIGIVNIDVGGNINFTSEKGTLDIEGSSGARSSISNPVSINAGKDLNINTGLDCKLTAGKGSKGIVYLNAGNKLNMNIGGSCYLTASSGGIEFIPRVPCSVVLNGNLGVNASIGKDLILQGGSNSSTDGSQLGNFVNLMSDNGSIDLAVGQDLYVNGGSSLNCFAAIQANTGNILLSVERDLVLQSGTANGTFAQIGSLGWFMDAKLLSLQLPTTFLSRPATANISISKIGRNAILNADNTFTNNYAAIGNGNFGYANLFNLGTGNLSGNINVNGTANTSLTLNGGLGLATGGTFAQIGHFEGLFNSGTQTIAGNVSLHNFGGDINLNPNNSYAAIGHGTATSTSYPGITGNITVDHNKGNINLNAGTAEHTFSQIGHFAANSLSGNVTVNTTGNLNLIAGGFDYSKAVIGHGNYYSPANAFNISNILASANTIFLNGGSSASLDTPNANAIIGFERGALTDPSPITIGPSSTVTVNALNNINLEGGFNSRNLGGNAIIGFSEPTITTTTTIEHINVTTTQGDITLTAGNNGIALIGVNGISSSDSIPLQCNVEVNALNGTVTLFGTPSTNIQTVAGKALISTGQFFNQFDLNLRAKNLNLFGSTGTFAGPGTASVNASRNFNLILTGDLNLTGNNGFCTLSQGSGPLTASIDGSVSLLAGRQRVQIGNNTPNLSKNSIVFEKIGGNLLLRGGTRLGASAIIGNGVFTTSGTINSDITFANVGGNINLFGNSGNLSRAIIGNGFAFTGTSLTGDVNFERIGGNLNIKGGDNTSACAVIGNGILSSGTINGNINFGTIVGNVQLLGSLGNQSSASIGHGVDGSPSSITGNIIFDNIGGNLNLQGGIMPLAAAVIGHGLVGRPGTVRGDVIINQVTGNVNLSSGSDTSTNAQIGHPGFNNIASFIAGDVRLNNIRGSVNLTGGTSSQFNSAVIGLGSNYSTNTTENLSGQVVVHAKNVNLTAGAGAKNDAVIGFSGGFATSGSIISSPLVEVTAEGPITLTSGNDSNATIGFSEITANNINLEIDAIHVIANEGDITLIGGNPGENQSGIAAIGTLAGIGTIKSSIKVKTPFDLILKNTSSPSGLAIITNNSYQSNVGSGTVSIDPARIILLAGTGITTGNVPGAVIYSSGDLNLNFTDALYINYDANNPSQVQNNSAQIIAKNNIEINTKARSFGEIIVQGGSFLGNPTTSAISSIFGNIQIGTKNRPGANDITISASIANGSANISAAKDLFINVNDDLTITALADPNSEAPLAGISSGNDLKILAGGDINLQGADRVEVDNFQNVKVTNNSGDMVIKAKGSLTIGLQSAIQSAIDGGYGSLHIDVGSNLKMNQNGLNNQSAALIQNQGTGELKLRIGQDLTMGSDAQIRNLLNSNTTFNIGRDTLLSEAAAIKNIGSGNILINTARDFLASGSASILSSGISDVNINAHRLYAMSDSSSINHDSTGLLKIQSENISLSNSSSTNVSGSGDLYLIADQNIELNDASTVTTNKGNLTLVVDNAFPKPNFFGTGKFVMAEGATINSNGGATRIFTSRREFNSIAGLINGQRFIQGIEFLNTPQEQWGKYFETASFGHPFTIYYKDNGTALIPPVINIPKNAIHNFRVATAEAFQEWRVLDELYLVPFEFCSYSDCGQLICQNCEDDNLDECYKYFYKEFVTYNTKKLFNIYYN